MADRPKAKNLITTSETSQPRPVRAWVRALAWIIVITGIPAIGWMIYSLLAGGIWPGMYRAMQVAAAIWLLPLFAYVAINGRAPRSWLGMGSTVGEERSSSRFCTLFAAIRSRL
jgi:hypothetical protein